MKKKIFNFSKKTLCAAICLVLFFGSAIPAMSVSRYYKDKSITATQNRFKWFYEQEENSIDVVYLGSSSVYRYDINVQNYDEYGFTSAGLCSAAQPFVATKYLMEEALKTQKPKLFVVDVRRVVRSVISGKTGETAYAHRSRLETYYASLFMSMKQSSTRWRMIDAVIDEAVLDPDYQDDTKHIRPEDADEEALSWQLEFLRYHNTWKDFDSFDELVNAITSTEKYDEVASVNGVSLSKGMRSYSKFKGDYENTTDVEPLPECYQKVFDDLLDYIRENDLNVLFISTPYISCTDDHKKVQNYISQYLTEEGFDYIDMHDHLEEIGLEAENDFYDKLHTNLYGAEKCTRYLGKIISEKIGKCEHSKAVDKSWKQAFKNWQPQREILAQAIENKISKEED